MLCEFSGLRPNSSSDPLFRTSFGRATLPPGEGISLRRDFFDKLTPDALASGVSIFLLAQNRYIRQGGFDMSVSTDSI